MQVSAGAFTKNFPPALIFYKNFDISLAIIEMKL